MPQRQTLDADAFPAEPVTPLRAPAPAPVAVWIHDGPVCVAVLDGPKPDARATACRCGGCHSTALADQAIEFF